MFWKYPFCSWFAPKKDGLYIVRHQGRVYHIGIAFKKHTGKNLRQAVKYRYNNQNSEIDFMQMGQRDLTSIKFIIMDDYEKALDKREELYKVHEKRVKRYEF